VIRGGDVVAPEAGRRRADVFVRDGRIVEAGEAARAIDATGKLVVPGLVDLHAHVFAGQDLGVDPDVVGPASGTTTFVDTGTAGAHLFGAFRRGTIERAVPSVRAFLNISTIGVTSMRLAGELENLAYCDVDACVACAREHADLVLGVKVRASANVVGAAGDEPLRRARAAADRLGLPLMVHIGQAPSGIETVLAALGEGDVLTHCFSGWRDNGLLLDGRVRPSVLAAQRRGVRFDVGHGMGSFDAEVARALLDQGFAPDAISSDIHAYSRDAVGDLPAVMSKFLALGLSLEEVVARTTLHPARALGLDAGTLRVGAPADVAVLELLDGPVEFEDTWGHAFAGERRLRTVTTVQRGEVVHG
jgi:dihydroorotase